MYGRTRRTAARSLPEPRGEQLRGRLLAAAVGEAGINRERDARNRVPGERGRLGESRTGVERERDERVPQIVQPYRRATVAVEPGGVSGRVERPQRVTRRLGPSRG